MKTLRRPPKPLPEPAAPDLRKLLEACEVESSRHRRGYLACPLCRKRHRAGAELPLDSLVLHPTFGNDHAFRCHRCGFAGNGLLLHWSLHRDVLSWEEHVARLVSCGVFGGGAPDPDWEGRWRIWAEFESLFEKAKSRLRMEGDRSPLKPCEIPWIGQIGEAGTLTAGEFFEFFHPRTGNPGSRLPEKVRIRLVRTLHGLPAYLAVDSVSPGMELLRYHFCDPGPVELAVPEWALHRDWSTEIVAATDLGTAQGYLETISKPSAAGREFAAVWILNCRGPVHEEIPARRIHYLAGPRESGEFALAFCGGPAEVGVWRWSGVAPFPDLDAIRAGETEAAGFLAERITAATESGPHAAAYLGSVLTKPWMGVAAAGALSAAARRRLGEGFDDFVREGAGTCPVLRFAAERATYLCRNGIYLKAGARGRNSYRPCSNFSLVVEETSDTGDGNLAHLVELRMQGASTRFPIGDEDFRSGPKLLRRAFRAALEAGFPHLPTLPGAEEERLLPSIILGTQSPPRARLDRPTHWGFGPLAFHGPGYRAARGGLVRRPDPAAPPRCLAMLAPELEGVAPGEEDAFLRYRAAELASWICGADAPDESDAVASVVAAALLWCLRGARGLDSHLALPTPAHHALFASLVGVAVVELGRARPEHPGVPRVMAASYSGSAQFRRQGRIVAALEADDRRLDRRVACLVADPGAAALLPPSAPAPVLSLLACATAEATCLGEAEEALLAFVEEGRLRDETARRLRRGRRFIAPPGSYLRIFLERAGSLARADSGVVARPAGLGLVLLGTGSLERLAELGYRFDDRRLAEELASEHGVPKPLARFGRARTPVIRIPEKVFAVFDEAAERRRRAAAEAFPWIRIDPRTGIAAEPADPVDFCEFSEPA